MNEIRMLKYRKLPDCFAIGLAEGLANNEVLNKYWEDFMKIFSGWNQKTVFELLALQPVAKQFGVRIAESVKEELAKDRGLGIPCNECDLKQECFLSSLIFLDDRTKWFGEEK